MADKSGGRRRHRKNRRPSNCEQLKNHRPRQSARSRYNNASRTGNRGPWVRVRQACRSHRQHNANKRARLAAAHSRLGSLHPWTGLGNNKCLIVAPAKNRFPAAPKRTKTGKTVLRRGIAYLQCTRRRLAGSSEKWELSQRVIRHAPTFVKYQPRHFASAIAANWIVARPCSFSR